MGGRRGKFLNNEEWHVAYVWTLVLPLTHVHDTCAQGTACTMAPADTKKEGRKEGRGEFSLTHVLGIGKLKLQHRLSQTGTTMTVGMQVLRNFSLQVQPTKTYFFKC